MYSDNKIKPSGVCRCCLLEGYHQDMHQDYEMDGQRLVLWNVLNQCFDIHLTEDIRLSTQICKECTDQLQNAYKFRTLVLQSERRLLHAIGVNTKTEFVTVSDPLVEDDSNLKTEVKSEPYDHNEEDGCDLYETLPEDLVFGEREFLQRYKSIAPLPTRQSLEITCPGFFKHLESLKGKVIQASKIAMEPSRSKKVIKKPKHKQNKTNIKEDKHVQKEKKSRRDNLVISEKMAYLLNATTILENSNAVPFKSKMRSGFPCFYCKERFSNLKLVREHSAYHPKSSIYKQLSNYTADSLIVYADITDLKCTICDQNIPTIKVLKDHLVEIHNKKIYEGYTDRVICFKLEDKETNFDCHICGANLETFGAIDRHMNHHYNHYVCDSCGSAFITKHRLKVHTYMQHGKNNSLIKCEPCNKIFDSKSRYRIHHLNVHSTVKRAPCPLCPERFIDYYTRLRHMEDKHGAEPILYKCSACEMSFNRKYLLKCHFKRKHLESKDVQCELCPFMCYTKSELKDHMFRHGGVKRFVCAICKKAFMRKKTLTVHMRVHSNETRYSCHLCGEMFVHNWSLKSHLKTHSDDV